MCVEVEREMCETEREFSIVEGRRRQLEVKVDNSINLVGGQQLNDEGVRM